MIDINPVGLAVDPKALGDLKRRAVEDPEGALKAVAQQFEQLLLDQMMRAMRTAAPGDSLLDNDATRMFTGLLDQEFSRTLAAKGGLGLADLLVTQLTRLHAGSSQEISNLADKRTIRRSGS